MADAASGTEVLHSIGPRDFDAINPAVDGNYTPASGRMIRGVYVGTAGDLSVTTAAGNDRVMVGLAPGMWHQVFLQTVRQTGTTAGDILVCEADG